MAKQSSETDVGASKFEDDSVFPKLVTKADELVEPEIRDRFKRMCEGYYESVSKKLVIEHKVS